MDYSISLRPLGNHCRISLYPNTKSFFKVLIIKNILRRFSLGESHPPDYTRVVQRPKL